MGAPFMPPDRLSRQSPTGERVERHRIIIVPHKDGRPWRRRFLRPRNYYWAAEWSIHEGRWLLDMDGYAETIWAARRKALKRASLYFGQATRCEMEIALVVPEREPIPLRTATVAPELLTDKTEALV